MYIHVYVHVHCTPKLNVPFCVFLEAHAQTDMHADIIT